MEREKNKWGNRMNLSRAQKQMAFPGITVSTRGRSPSRLSSSALLSRGSIHRYVSLSGACWAEAPSLPLRGEVGSEWISWPSPSVGVKAPAVWWANIAGLGQLKLLGEVVMDAPQDQDRRADSSVSGTLTVSMAAWACRLSEEMHELADLSPSWRTAPLFL